MLMNNIKGSDPEVYQLILNETNRIENGVELIPSENFVSRAVLQAMGSVFTNKYSEGYPKRRYYGGQEFVDKVENLAIERAKKLFGAEHVNVQPYSGSPANQAVFFALLNLGDKYMGLDMNCGGHLTHGSPVNFSGIQYRPIPYFVDRETELIDMDEVRKLALKNRPKMIISSLTAYPRKLDFKEFQEICQEVDAYHLADISHIAGLIVGSVHESPFPFTDVITTTSHKTLRGPRGAVVMCKKEDRLHDEYHGDTEKNLAQLIDSAVFPGLQGGPHDHITAAKAVAFGEALRRVQGVRAPDSEERQGIGRGADGAGRQAGHRRDGQPPHAHRPQAEGPQGEGEAAPERDGQGQHNAEQERGAFPGGESLQPVGVEAGDARSDD